jgi:homoserine trans-succinylase
MLNLLALKVTIGLSRVKEVSQYDAYLPELAQDGYYRGADKSLARPTSRFVLFDGENISFDASLVIYINSTNIPPILIINRIYETQNLLSL